MSAPLKILVMGAGAIGCFVGGTLARAGHQVKLIGRRPLMSHIAEHGLTITWPEQPPQSVFPATGLTPGPATEPYDFILLTVKSPATAQAARQLAAQVAVGARPYVVSLQNGIGNEESVARLFGAKKVIAGTITIPIETPQMGQIAVSKAKGGLGLAPLTTGQPVEQLAAALNQAGLKTILYSDYQAMKWSKLLLNIINNAASAILKQPPAAIIDNPALLDLEIGALREGVVVMTALGLQPVKLPGYPVPWLARLVAAPWLPPALKRAILRPFLRGGRGSKMPSLYLDLAAGRRRTEIEALNGAIVAAGAQTNVATPVNRLLTEVFSAIAAGQADWSTYQHQPAKLLHHLPRMYPES